MKRLVTLALAAGLLLSLAAPAAAAGGGNTTNGLWYDYSDGDLWKSGYSISIKLPATRACTSSEKPVAQLLIKSTDGGSYIASVDRVLLRMYSDDIGGQGFKEKLEFNGSVNVSGDWKKIKINGTNIQTTGPDGADVNDLVDEGLYGDVKFDSIYASSNFKVRGKIWCANA